jgi:chromosome segregation ATPase
MPATPSVMNLHLRYRLWIAELNADINVLRILNDYIIELENKKKVPEVAKGTDQFKKQFTSLRTQIDELSHEMHLLKMKLAAFARENKPLTKKIISADNHKALKRRYAAFRKLFSRTKKEFGKFEGKWLV